MTTATFPMPEGTQFFPHPVTADFPTRDTEPIEETILTDAEEEELAVLWAADRGNQGA
jgi:hypothetical protein